jgi:hypothetical protein
MKSRLSGRAFDFARNGEKLISGEEYTLIYYPDPWPESGLIGLEMAKTNRGGNIHIKEAPLIETDLPIARDLDNRDNSDHATSIAARPASKGQKYGLCYRAMWTVMARG